jgi:glycosyltransferase involved in cell wall biosynthesis
MDPTADVETSVIVPCRNAALHLRQLLQSLVDQEYEHAWEVVVVDNASSDESSKVAGGFADRLNLRIVEANDTANPSYARNVGWQRTSSEKLLFIDADDEVAPGYIAAMARALNAHDMVTSRVDSTSLNPAWVRESHGPAWQQDGILTFFEFLPAAGNNIGIRRSLLQTVGGFPEEFSASEDIALSWRIQLIAGAHIHFVGSAVYRYRYRDSLLALYRQSRGWGMSNVLLYLRFRDRGMPGRTPRLALAEWLTAIGGMLKARTRQDRARSAVQLGYCVGRLQGSLRYRVAYL